MKSPPKSKAASAGKARKLNTRYLVGVFKEGRGAGLLTVFARSPKQAEQCAINLIGKRKLDVGYVISFRQWATPQVYRMAINKFISDAWNPLMKKS